MKKLLSMILALAMVMSLFCAVPVSAASTEFTLPYVNYDFNDIADGATSNYGDSIGTWNAKEYVEGVAGGKALYKESTSVSSGSAYLSYTLSGGTPAVMASGEQFKISFWLKLNTEKTKFASTSDPSTLQVCYTANGGAKGYKAYNFGAQVAELNTGKWVYYEQTFAGWNGINTVGSGTYNTVTNPDGATLAMQFRLGYQNGTGPAGVLAAGYNTTYAIAIDDFRIEPVRTPYDPNNVVEEEYEPEVRAKYSFNTANSGDGINILSTGVTNNANKSCISTGGKQGGYLQIDRKAGGSYQAAKNGWYDITWTARLNRKYNTLTKMTIWAKALDSTTVGSKLRWRIYYENSYRLDGNETGANVYQGGQYHYIEVPGALTTEWQEFVVYYKRNVKSFDESGNRIALQMMNPNANGMLIGFDEMLVEDYVIPTNAEFENINIPVTKTVGQSGNVMTGEDSLKYATNLYGWIPATGATVTADTTVKHGGSQAAKVVTSEANELGGIYQGIYLANNNTYEFKVWAKGEGDSVGKNLSVVLDRYVASKDSDDLYNVPDKVTLSMGTLTNEWKEFTATYELAIPEPNPAFSSSTSSHKIGLRQPMMYFNVDGGAAGMTYYLDDLKVGEAGAAHAYPYVTNYDMLESDYVTSATPVEGKSVVIDYLASTEVTSDSPAAVVTRVMIETGIGTNKFGTYQTIVDDGAVGLQDFTIPEGFAGRKIKISVQPFSEDGVIGAHYEKVIGTIAKQYEASMTAGAYNPASSSLTTTYSVTNNKVDGSTVRAIMFTMFYAEDGSLVKCVQNPVVVENGTTVTDATFTATSTVSDTNLPAPTSAKVFFWFTEGTDTPSVFNTSMVEVLPMQEVSLQ